jgi:hypothetical protein
MFTYRGRVSSFGSGLYSFPNLSQETASHLYSSP